MEDRAGRTAQADRAGSRRCDERRTGPRGSLMPALPLVLLLLLLPALAAAQEDGCSRLGDGPCSCENLEAGSFRLLCNEPLNFHYRFTYGQRPTGEGVMIIFCDPRRMRREEYEKLYSYNMTLGVVDEVMFTQCPLPPGRLVDFLHRLGTRGPKSLIVRSLNVLNDTMPADYLYGSNLTEMKLEDLTRIELHADFFESQSHLEELFVTYSTLELPGALFQHTPRLSRLGLTKTGLRTLPEHLFDGLTQLRQLSLGDNRLSTLTRRHFRDLGQLDMLQLYKNEIRELPGDAFEPLVSLQTLEMQYNPLERLPESLFARTSELHVLRLHHSGRLKGNLTHLPEGLFQGLTKLEQLTLDRLGIRELPAGIFAGLTRLANLTLDFNQLTELPETVFSGMTNLRNVDLRANMLTEVPPQLLRGLVMLDTIYLARNRLRTLPNDLFAHTRQMDRLFLDDNELTELPVRTFAGLRNLRVLHLQKNNLTLEGRPVFQMLARLRELNLSQNKIQLIPQDLPQNLLKLSQLDLHGNRLQRITTHDVNFLCEDAFIDLRYNNISTIDFRFALSLVEGNDKRKPNLFDISKNPLHCDCRMWSFRAYLDRSGPFARRQKLDELFQLKTDSMNCATPERFEGRPFSALSPDQLLCPLEVDCPAGCDCQEQSSQQTVLVACPRLPAGAPVPTRLPRADHYGVSLHLEDNRLQRLSNLSLTNANLTELHLSRNNLSSLPASLLPPALRLLKLDHNNFSHVEPDLIGYLERTGANVSLGFNPFVCDCELLPLYSFIQEQIANKSRQVVDVDNVWCLGENRTLLEMTADEVCTSRVTTLIAICVVTTGLAMCALVTAVIYYNYSETIKVWLFAHNMCLSLITEEELDTDKKYDAFVSYSHLDEEFVVEKLVPELERGDPKYSLCLHFRDWLAGEWITDQIQRSVQDSRRVIVIMSQNFIQSEWGRLEFLAAHKQAMSDRCNRVILVVYGQLPDPATMDPELRAYVSLNTYLQWGDPLFWPRLRYALPHKGRRLKSRRRRRLTSDKLGLILRDGGLSSAGSTPAVTPTTEIPATPANGHAKGEVNGCFVGDKLAPIAESRLREQCCENIV